MSAFRKLHHKLSQKFLHSILCENIKSAWCTIYLSFTIFVLYFVFCTLSTTTLGCWLGASHSHLTIFYSGRCDCLQLSFSVWHQTEYKIGWFLVFSKAKTAYAYGHLESTGRQLVPPA